MNTWIHPYLVHFPIALWLFGTLWWTVGWARGNPSWRETAWVPLVTGALMSLPTAMAGQRDAGLWGEASETMARHQSLGNLVPWVLIAAVILKAHTAWRPRAKALPEWVWAGVLWGASGLLITVAGLGGDAVYERISAVPAAPEFFLSFCCAP